MTVVLYGYRYSVYLRIARLALLEKGVAHERVEVNPFAPLPPDYLALHPFGRVPVLEHFPPKWKPVRRTKCDQIDASGMHDGFALYETAAIAAYVDEAFPGPSLQPAAPRERARMTQIISISDAEAYWPLVRQVFAHRVFRPRVGERSDESEIRRGLDAAPRVLGALDALAGDEYLAGDALSLADLHLAAMIAYFTAAPEGAATLAAYPRLSRWWERLRARPSLAASDPGLPGD